MENPEISYLPGDHLAVFPVNPDVEIDLILSHLTNFPGDPKTSKLQLQEFENSHWIPAPGIPKASLRRLLKHHLCLSSSPTQVFLADLSRHAHDKREKEMLKKLSTDFMAYDKWRKNSHPSIVDVFRQFSSLKGILDLTKKFL